MKSLFVILSLVAMSAMAKPAPKALALVKVKYVEPGRPGQLVKVYENGVVENYECPITDVPCHVVAKSQLNDLEIGLLNTTAQQALEMPAEEPPKDDKPHCMAMPNEYREFYVVTAHAKQVKVSEEASPCGHPSYKNSAAQSLTAALNKLIKRDEH